MVALVRAMDSWVSRMDKYALPPLNVVRSLLLSNADDLQMNPQVIQRLRQEARKMQ